MHPDAFACALNECIVFNRTEGHIPRIGIGGVKTHSEPPLGIHSHKKRYFRERLVLIGEFSLTFRSSFREDNPTDVVFFDEVFNFFSPFSTYMA